LRAWQRHAQLLGALRRQSAPPPSLPPPQNLQAPSFALEDYVKGRRQRTPDPGHAARLQASYAQLQEAAGQLQTLAGQLRRHADQQASVLLSAPMPHPPCEDPTIAPPDDTASADSAGSEPGAGRSADAPPTAAATAAAAAEAAPQPCPSWQEEDTLLLMQLVASGAAKEAGWMVRRRWLHAARGWAAPALATSCNVAAAAPGLLRHGELRRCDVMQAQAAAAVCLEVSLEELQTYLTLWEVQPFTNEGAVLALLDRCRPQQAPGS